MKRVLCVVMLFAGSALADIPPPDVSGCREKTAGAACKRDDGSAGTCAKAKCSRNDYSEGPPPKSVQYDCLKCAPPEKAPEKKKN